MTDKLTEKLQIRIRGGVTRDQFGRWRVVVEIAGEQYLGLECFQLEASALAAYQKIRPTVLNQFAKCKHGPNLGGYDELTLPDGTVLKGGPR